MKLILEGITGAGKSSSIGFIKQFFNDHGKSVSIADCTSKIVDLSKNVRRYLKDCGEPLIPQLLINQMISYMKLLEADSSDILLIDRYILSDLVYTLAKAELSKTDINLQKSREGILYPLGLNPLEKSMTIYFDVDAAIARERTLKRTQRTVEGYTRNDFNLELQSSASKFYKQEIPLLKSPAVTIDANNSLDYVHHELEGILSRHLA